VVDDLVVHGAAAEGVGVGDEHGVEGVGVAGVEKGLEAAGGSAEILDGLDLRAEAYNGNPQGLRFKNDLAGVYPAFKGRSSGQWLGSKPLLYKDN
jgi:hypothetical protein